MPGPLPIILLSGLGADERLLAAQQLAFVNLTVARWIEPGRNESLPDYARRMAEAVDPGGPCVVGGVSFGGMVAVEMAPHLDARACILISSIRSPRELPWRYRVLRPLAWVLPDWLGWAPVTVARLAWRLARRRLPPVPRSLLEQFAAMDGRFLLWAAKTIVRWRPAIEPLSVPVYQIHGDRDHTLPGRLTRPEKTVPGAGHIMVMTHAEAVNEFLREKTPTCQY